MGYTYDGRTFPSIKSLAAYTGMNAKTLTARLRRGMEVEEACKQTDFRCRYFKEGDMEKSLVQLCRDHQKDKDLVRNRLIYGYSIDEALNSPKKITKQGEPVLVFGIRYDSLAAAVRKFNLQPKESKIRRHIKMGRAPDTVFREVMHELEDAV